MPSESEPELQGRHTARCVAASEQASKGVEHAATVAEALCDGGAAGAHCSSCCDCASSCCASACLGRSSTARTSSSSAASSATKPSALRARHSGGSSASYEASREGHPREGGAPSAPKGGCAGGVRGFDAPGSELRLVGRDTVVGAPCCEAAAAWCACGAGAGRAYVREDTVGTVGARDGPSLPAEAETPRAPPPAPCARAHGRQRARAQSGGDVTPELR